MRAIAAACLAAAAAAAVPGVAGADDVVGAIGVHIVREDETLLDVALRRRLGYVELMAANPGVDPWVLRRGTPLLLPTAHLLPDAPRRGIVINLADQRLYHFLPGGGVESMAIGIGDEATATPLGETRVVDKRARPTWYPPKSIRAANPALPAAVAPGPDNPLGEYALYLGWPSYAIHGTNKPLSIGRMLTHGCIRLYPEDIARLFATVAVGTPVHVVDQPVKVGWSGDWLFLEVQPSREQAMALDAGTAVGAASPADLADLIVGAAQKRPGTRIDWQAVHDAAAARRGVPVAIAR